MDYPIRPVCGNWTRFIHPLEKVVWQNSQKTIVDYVPQEGDTLTVTLQGAYKPYTMENVTIEGNVLKYENNGTLPCGVYDIVINVVLADGKRLRSHQDCIVKVVKTNREASIPDYVEFGVDTYVLDGAVFMYVPIEQNGASGLYPLVSQTLLTVEIAPNTFNVWADEISNNLTITFGAEVSGVMNEYLMQFSIASGATPQINIAASWASIMNFQGGKTYQISVVNGYAIGVEFDTITSNSQS